MWLSSLWSLVPFMLLQKWFTGHSSNIEDKNQNHKDIKKIKYIHVLLPPPFLVFKPVNQSEHVYQTCFQQLTTSLCVLALTGASYLPGPRPVKRRLFVSTATFTPRRYSPSHLRNPQPCLRFNQAALFYFTEAQSLFHVFL